jgi:DNA-binding response OmpR family regulator
MKVLLLEDDRRLARFLARALSEEGLAVDVCGRGSEALAQAGALLYDMVVLDWIVPDTDGLTVCRELRQAGGTAPVMMITARGETQERVLGLDAGADDYLVKPFEVDEFMARIRALLRRASSFGKLRCGELEIDPIERQATIGGVAMALTSRELAMLLHLAQRSDRVVKRSEMLAHVCQMNFDPGSNLVDVHISRLRDKLGSHAWMIETIRGVGYKLRDQEPP